MKSKRIILKKKIIKQSFKKTNKRIILKHRRKIKYLAISFLIILIYFVSYFKVIKHKYNNINNILYENLNIKEFINDTINLDNQACQFIKYKLEKRTRPFDYENELIFITSLISCKIPFSFIRFGDGEEFIMRGNQVQTKVDNWMWKPKNQKFRKHLIESVNICTNINNFISIPCKNWYNISKSILSFSKCNSTKYMSFATLFINKNFPIFKDFISHFVSNTNRWKIILVANSNINQNISWAYKYYPINNNIVENWDEFSKSKLPKLIREAQSNNLIFFISAGPAANIIISLLSKINNNNIYIDFGSSIELITKGYSTRPYSNKKSIYSYQTCEPFILKDNKLFFKMLIIYILMIL